jgi:hypothetical protein
MKQEVLGRTNRLFFDMTWTAEKTKKLGGDTQQGDFIGLLTKIRVGENRQTDSKMISKDYFCIFKIRKVG